MRKKVDERVRILIENGVKLRNRTLFVIVGDHAKEQVPNLHYILAKSQVKARPNVLWCYDKELGFSTHRQKRMKEIKKAMQRGLYDTSKENSFDTFISSTDIRWCYFKESQNILGNTFGMCVIQDFEALTPNILARTIETVEGGGIVVILFHTVTSLKQLYTMTMDVHNRFRTESHSEVTGRFNERFILSLGDCHQSLVLDDELNVLPISSHFKTIQPISISENEEGKDGSIITDAEKELKELKLSLADTQPVGSLVELARTIDQARAILTFLEAVSEKTLRSTVALTAARGRGKSAALGLCLAGAIGYGYSNIFVTAPSPENLKTMFEFVIMGLQALKYSEHLDFEILRQKEGEMNHCVVRINVFREHRQTIQYIHPDEHQSLAQAELVAIDEAAAIPLPIVKKLLGNYLVFMASTVNGYEGTGRSLSLKLIQQLREQQGQAINQATAQVAASVRGSGKKKGGEKVHEERWKRAAEAAENLAAHGGGSGMGRVLREIVLETPIRYGPNDPVERWLNELLCLDIKNSSFRLLGGFPAPEDCELYYVDRDALFSYHKLSERFLQRMMSLYTAAHYKNQPNDLQLLSDAPSHHVFVLLGPNAMEVGNSGELPDIYCLVQVALEGKVSKKSIKDSFAVGHRAAGDLIPWTVSQQFNDMEFAALSGARIVRIATHLDVHKMGYGTRAVQLLVKFFQGDLVGDYDEMVAQEKDAEEKNQSDDDDDNNNQGNSKKNKKKKDTEKASLLTEKIKPKKNLPPLLIPVTEKAPIRLHWLGVSFGVTQQLIDFWSKNLFRLVYLRQTPNDLTGEYTGILLKKLETKDIDNSPQEGWLDAFVEDCQRRLSVLLSSSFSNFEIPLGLSLLDAKKCMSQAASTDDLEENNELGGLRSEESRFIFTSHDLKRLEMYSRNMVDYHMITDLLPQIARLFFQRKLPQIRLSYLQCAILFAMGLQNRTIDYVSNELQLPANQILALFNKSIRKFSTAFNKLEELAMSKEMFSEEIIAKKEKEITVNMRNKKDTSLLDDMEKSGQKVSKELKSKQEELLKSLDLDEYKIQTNDDEWDNVIQKSTKNGNTPTSIAIPSNHKNKRKFEENSNNNNNKRKANFNKNKKQKY